MRKNVFNFTLDIKRASRIVIPRIVNGDTSNRFVITLKDGGNNIELSSTLDKVYAIFRRADGQVYVQDEDHGVSKTNGGSVVTVDVYASSFRTGENTIELAIYSREQSSDTEYEGLITTNQAFFTARNENLSDHAGTSLSQLPMLEQLIHDAGVAVDNCNTATTAANAAAGSANSAAAAANAAAALIDANGVPLLLTPDGVEWDGNVFSCAIEESYDDVIATHSDGVYRPLMIVVDGYLLQERSYSFSGTHLTVHLSTDTGIQGGGVTASLTANSTYHTVGVIGYKTRLEEPLYLNYSDGFSYNDLKEAWDDNRQVYLIETLNGYPNYKAIYRLSHLDYDGSTYYAGFIGSAFQTWRTKVMVTCWGFTSNDPDEGMTES